jgi:hypothetical protein
LVLKFKTSGDCAPSRPVKLRCEKEQQKITIYDTIFKKITTVEKETFLYFQCWRYRTRQLLII